ncbi:hypothetical protein PN4B1_16820 [Paenibacillus naphthalenovorans]|nr:hypothetical protein PN4B1_16820 [Paenibacillus naphthalenovorans]
MIPIPLLYYVESESGHHRGYIMSLEIAKRMDMVKTSSNEREGTVETFSDKTRSQVSSHNVKTPIKRYEEVIRWIER